MKHADKSMSYDYARETARWHRRAAIKRLSLWIAVAIVVGAAGGSLMNDATSRSEALTALLLLFLAAGAGFMAIVEIMELTDD